MKNPVGTLGENIASKYLQQIGYKTIERNFRIGGGEIDIIAIDGTTVVYIEVKTRSSHLFGLGEESVNYHKIKFIERASKFFRLKHKNLPESERIDVIAVDLQTRKLRHIKNAGF